MSQAGIAGTPGGGGSSVVNIAGDTGIATGTTITIKTDVATLNDGQTPQFNNSGSTSILSFSDNNGNTILGSGAGLTGSSAGFNTVIGVQAGASNISGQGGNTLLGWQAGNAITTGNNNLALGQSSLQTLTTGSHNFGTGLPTLTTGSFNLAWGLNAGFNYTSSESSNLLINNPGVLGESNVMRIGVQGAGDAQQNQCFIAGIVGNTVSNTEIVAIDSTTGQLGVLADPLTVANGGTGDSSFPAFSVVCGGISSTDPLQNVSGLGNSGEVLTSNGAAALPTWQPAGGAAVSPIFIAYASTTTTLLTNTYVPIVFDGIIINTGSAFDGTSTFTAPKTGTYHFTFAFNIHDLDVTTTALLVVINSSEYGRIILENISPFPVVVPTSPTVWGHTVSTDLFINATTTVTCEIYLNTTAGAPTTLTGYTNGTIFSGYFVG